MTAQAMAELLPYVPGTFWLTAALVILTVALIWLAWRTLKGKEEKAPILTWSVSAVPLLASNDVVREELTVSWQDQVLIRPTLATFKLTNTGTGDLGAGAFDGGRAITVTFGAPILAQLAQTSGQSMNLLPVVTGGNELRIGPGLLHVGKGLSVAVLVDGNSDFSEIFPFVNIEVENEHQRLIKEYEQSSRRLRRQTAFFARGAVATIVLILISTLLLYVNSPK
jgi:hypothetical protein